MTNSGPIRSRDPPRPGDGRRPGRFVITAAADPDPIVSLRQALKVLLRRFGLRCVDLKETRCDRSIDDAYENTRGTAQKCGGR